jgi:uncharacterized membrane protein YidH (DUF202 family)
VTETALRDPGLQPERTELAWRRTWITLATAGIVAGRLLVEVFQRPEFFAISVVSAACCAVGIMMSRRRFRHADLRHHAQTGVDAAPLPIFAVAVAVFLLAIAGAVIVAALANRR